VLWQIRYVGIPTRTPDRARNPWSQLGMAFARTLDCDPTFKPARGLHEPLVAQEAFDGNNPNLVSISEPALSRGSGCVAG